MLRCPHRCQFALAETRVGCINRPNKRIVVRRRGDLHRLQFREVKSVVNLTVVSASWQTASAIKVEPTLASKKVW